MNDGVLLRAIDRSRSISLWKNLSMYPKAIITVSDLAINPKKMRDSKGHFVKGNKEGFIPGGDKPLTAHIGLKLTEDKKGALRQIPQWRDKLRSLIDAMIKEHGT